MTYLKIVQYIYLIMGAFFIYDAFRKYQNQESYALSLLFAAMAIGMFFFRRHLYNKQKK